LVAIRVVDTREVSGAPRARKIALIGVVERIDSPRVLNVHSRAGPGVIRFSDDATFFRGHSKRVTGLAAFMPGDEVVAEGEWVADGFAATSLLSTYRFVEGRIVRRQGMRLETTDATIQLIPDTKILQDHGFISKPLAQVGVGDEIVADVWRDPSTGQFLALRLGVRESRA
jgi:hypothetical protein